MAIHYRCPLCQAQLNQSNKSFICASNHCFDLAKEGYVNLLPVQNKKSKAPGDNAEMIQARRRFLEQGHYQRFADALKHAYSTYCNNSTETTMIDIGSGEGYYTHQFADISDTISIHGIDISKPAVKTCAKKYRNQSFAVASAFSLPFFEEQFDFALSVFSPFDLNEIARVLKTGATLVVAGPGPEHLKELAAQVYDEVQPHKGNKADTPPDNMNLIHTECIKEHITLDGPTLNDLLLMTPYYWSCTEEKKQTLSSLPTLSVQLDFDIRIFKKHSAS